LELLYRGKHYPALAQVALFDAEDPAAWPPLAAGSQAAVGPKGIAVATLPPSEDTEVEIVVYRGLAPPDGILCATGIIEVGSSGLFVGTEAPINVSAVAWPKGFVPVAAYLDGAAKATPRVSFVLGTTHIPVPQLAKSPAPELVAAIDALLHVPHQPHTLDLYGTSYPTGGLLWQLRLSSAWDEAIQEINRALDGVRHLLGKHRFWAYKRIIAWNDLHSTDSNTIVVCPGKNQYDMLRFEQGVLLAPTRADTEWYIATLKRFHRAYGINIRGVGDRVIEFVLQRTLAGSERSHFLDQLLAFCPDIMQAFPYTDDDTDGSEQGAYEQLYDHPYFNIQDRRIALWWD
jgi:Domain of unknown function (DUF4253)